VSQILVENANTWRLSGELSFATVGALLTEFTQRATHTPPKVVDLCDVTRTDSAGLALLIEWIKLCTDEPINFRNIPAQMLSIATVSGVENILTGTLVPTTN
jgi:phospholipid transport system transporter-binding protein